MTQTAPRADLERAKKAVSAVYLATEASVADDLSGILRGLIAEVEYRRSDPVREELAGALGRLLDDAITKKAWLNDPTETGHTGCGCAYCSARVTHSKAEGHTP